MRWTRIAGVGHHVPSRVVTNHDLEALMETSDEWIQERTGIKERHFVELGVAASDLGAVAARAALASAGWETADIQFIVFATLSPDMFFPGSGVFLQRLLGLEGIGALDVRNQCTGFIYGLAVADALIRSGMYDRILLVGAEVHSAGLRMDSRGRDTAVLFGDGAGAVCLTATDGADGSRLIRHQLHADGRFAEQLCLEAPGCKHRPFVTKEMIDDGRTVPYMNGREVFRHAVTRFPQVIMEALEAEGLEKEALDLVIPHQANLRITEAVRQRMELPPEKVVSNIDRFGNTTAASIPIALSEAVNDGRVRPGSLVCLAAFGSGFTWGASLLRY